MNAPRFFFTIIGSGALTLGVAFASEPSRHPAEKDLHQQHATSIRPAVRDQTDRKHSPLNNNGLVAPMNTQNPRTSGNQVRQPALNRAATAANAGLMINRTDNHHPQPASLPGASAATAAWSGLVRNRGAVPAGIGGLTTTGARNSTTALDGAAVKTKPRPK
jgi:hypothetical protein